MDNPELISLNYVDYGIIGIVLLSVLVGIIRGFVKEALSLTSWIVALWVSFNFSDYLAALFVEKIETESLRLAIAFVSLFIVTLIIGMLVNYIIGQLVSKTGLAGTDRLLGLLFGFGRGILIVSLVLLMGSLTSLTTTSWWQESHLIKYFQVLIDLLHNYLPQYINDYFPKKGISG